MLGRSASIRSDVRAPAKNARVASRPKVSCDLGGMVTVASSLRSEYLNVILADRGHYIFRLIWENMPPTTFWIGLHATARFSNGWAREVVKGKPVQQAHFRPETRTAVT